MPGMTAPPYASLTPDRVLDAVEGIGLQSDGRLLALNSYENRVYQIGIYDGPAVAGPLVVAKFYRPGRWSDEAILEEHAFVAELVGHEIPVVAPLALDGNRTLYAHQGFRFCVYPKRGGRVPELGDLNTLEWMGRFIGRIHAVGAVRPFRHRPTLDIASFGEAPRDFLLGGDWVPPDSSLPTVVSSNRPSWGCGAVSSGRVVSKRCACTATAMPATCSGPMTDRTSSISTTAAWDPPSRTCGCCSRAIAPR